MVLLQGIVFLSFSLLIGALLMSCTTAADLYDAIQRWSGYIPVSGASSVLKQLQTETTDRCAGQCSMDANCRGFIYDTMQRSCYLLNAEARSYSQLMQAATAVYMGRHPVCPEDFKFDPNGPFCHKAILTHSAGWVDASSTCQQNGAHLVSIETSQENAYLASTFSVPSGEYWTSGNDEANEGIWVWWQDHPLTYISWHHSQPDNGRSENYLVTRIPSGKWDDFPRDKKLWAICEVDMY